MLHAAMLGWYSAKHMSLLHLSLRQTRMAITAVLESTARGVPSHAQRNNAQSAAAATVVAVLTWQHQSSDLCSTSATARNSAAFQKSTHMPLNNSWSSCLTGFSPPPPPVVPVPAAAVAAAEVHYGPCSHNIWFDHHKSHTASSDSGQACFCV